MLPPGMSCRSIASFCLHMAHAEERLPDLQPRLFMSFRNRRVLLEQVVDPDKDQDEKYILLLGGRPISTATVVLRIDCTADDVLEAYVQAYVALQDEDEDNLVCCWPSLTLCPCGLCIELKIGQEHLVSEPVHPPWLYGQCAW